MARGTPSAAPRSASTHDSTRISRATRPRLAPSAARRACSRVRAMDRPSVRQATLAQAMSRTQPTAPKTASSMGRAGPTMSVTSGTAAARQSVWESGKRCSLSRASRSSSALACSRETPASSRATVLSRRAVRLRFAGLRLRGIQKSAVSPCGSDRCRPPTCSSPGAMMPITTNGRRDRLMELPTIDGFAPSRVRQIRSLRMTRSEVPGRSSFWLNVRPRAARAPRSSKKPALTNSPSRFSGPADPRNSWPSR